MHVESITVEFIQEIYNQFILGFDGLIRKHSKSSTFQSQCKCTLTRIFTKLIDRRRLWTFMNREVSINKHQNMQNEQSGVETVYKI